MTQYNNHTTPTIERFLDAQDRVEDLLEKKRAYLQSRADKGTISQAQVDYENTFMSAVIDYINRTDELLKSVGHAQRALRQNNSDAQQWKFRAIQAEQDNTKLKIWLRELGRQPDELLPYIKLSDCR